MRVKTVPRQRIMQNSVQIASTSDNFALKLGSLEDSSTSDDEETDLTNRTTEATAVSSKCKIQPLHTNLLKRSMAGPSNCKLSQRPLGKDTHRVSYNDGNNNIIPPHSSIVNDQFLPSSSKCSESLPEQNAIDTSVNNDDVLKAINLSKKSCHEYVEDNSIHGASAPDDKFKDTFLYKIMTDPTFLENIQRSKQSKKYTCQFCKQEFVNGEDLASHMDIKKDESNQVVCCACKKTFAQKRYLRYHQRCHSERTKFTCDICTKKFTRLDNLTRHNTFHVNPDKFSCTSCEKTFARKDLLNKHQKCHDNKYRFFCETCQKYFKGPLTLDNHKKIFHSVT